MSFQAGDLVVCVSAQPHPSYQPNVRTLEKLEKGVTIFHCSISPGNVPSVFQRLERLDARLRVAARLALLTGSS